MKASDRFFVDGVRCVLHGQDLPVANLSVGGFFAACERPPSLGQFVDVQMALGRRPPFRLTGKVTWINDPDDPKAKGLPRGAGIKIVRIDFPDKLAIVDYLKRIVHSEEGAQGERAR